MEISNPNNRNARCTTTNTAHQIRYWRYDDKIATMSVRFSL